MSGALKIEGQESLSAVCNNTFKSKSLQEMKGKSLSMIIEDVQMILIELSLKDKNLVAKAKHIGQDEQEAVITKKVAEYNRVNGITMSALSGCFHVTSAFLPKPFSIACKALGEASQSTKGHLDSQSESVRTGLDHSLQTKYGVVSNYSERMRTDEQGISQSLNTISQVFDKLQNLYMNILN